MVLHPIVKADFNKHFCEVLIHFICTRGILKGKQLITDSSLNLLIALSILGDRRDECADSGES